jgi:AsmA protein
VRFDLALNGMDLDRYLPPPARDGDAAPAPATPGEAAGAGASQLPLAPLRSLDVAGELDVGRLRLRGLRLDDLHMELDGRDGRFRLHPVSARLYQGRYSGDVRLDVRRDPPRVTLDERLEGVALGPLLHDAVGKAHVTGDADLEAALTVTGSEPRAMLRSLTGQGRYRLRDGTLAGIDLGRTLRAAYRALGKDGGGERAAGTRFRELNGSATIRDGRLHSDDLALDAQVMALTGKGYLDLAEARLDYRLTGKIADDAAIKELRGLTVPVRVTGPVADPAVRVDLAAALEQRAREKLEQEKEKAKKRLDERLQENKEDLKKQLEDKARELLPF